MSMKHSFPPSLNSGSSTTWILKCTDLPQFDALQAQADQFRTDDKLHLRNLCNDSSRCAGLKAVYQSQQRRTILLDYSRQRVTGETMELLFDLADAVGLAERREELRCGKRINATEGRCVLHHVLRMPANYHILLKDEGPKGHQFLFHHYLQQHQNALTQVGQSQRLSQPLSSSTGNVSAASDSDVNKPLDGPTVLQNVHAMRERIRDVSTAVRQGKYVSITGKPFKNFLCIAVGGTQLGVECVVEALRADPIAHKCAQGRTLRFLNNIDPVAFHLATRDWDAGETLVLVVGKTFNIPENMLNARTARNWLIEHLSDEDHGVTQEAILIRHMMAVSSNLQRCTSFGIDPENCFEMWDWIGPRFSVWSAAGILPLSLLYSYSVVCDFLNGAHDMDQHFFQAPLRDNLPVLMGLVSVWNSTFLDYSCRTILPYCQSLHRFPAYIQHLDMESNGKRVALDGTPLLHRSGEIVFGDVGTKCQNSFIQLLHQGRVVPADFIGFMESPRPVDLPEEAVSNHDELMSNFFGQPDALAYGKTVVDLIQEGVPEPLREHMVLTGNRPSSSLLLTKLDAFSLGQLMALYEHRVAVEGFIWGINSFDQFGVELGQLLSKHVRAQLSASRKTGASVQGFNYSTSSLLEHYLGHGKQAEQPPPTPPDSLSF